MSLDTMENALVHEMSDLLSAEQQFAKALNKVRKSADTAEVKQLAAEHYEETQEQIENLKQAFTALGHEPRGGVCRSAAGICRENDSKITQKKPQGSVKDVVLVSGTMRIEHFEIAGYSTAIALAKSLKKLDVMKYLQANLRQEQAAARKLELVGATLMNGGGKIHGLGISYSN